MLGQDGVVEISATIQCDMHIMSDRVQILHLDLLSDPRSGNLRFGQTVYFPNNERIQRVLPFTARQPFGNSYENIRETTILRGNEKPCCYRIPTKPSAVCVQWKRLFLGGISNEQSTTNY